MTPNTTQNKAAFMACYYGQKVLNDGCGEYLYPLTADVLKSVADKDYLLLRQLSSITDEEAIEIARIANNLSFSVKKTWIVERDDEYKYITVKSNQSHHAFDISYVDGTVIMYYDDNKTDIETNHYGCLDYLRSIGIATPWRDLSVSQIKEYGWIKIKE